MPNPSDLRRQKSSSSSSKEMTPVAAFSSAFQTQGAMKGTLMKRGEILTASLTGPYLCYEKGAKSKTRTLFLCGAKAYFDNEQQMFTITKDAGRSESYEKVFSVIDASEYYLWKTLIIRALFLWSMDDDDNSLALPYTSKSETLFQTSLRSGLQSSIAISMLGVLTTSLGKDFKELITDVSYDNAKKELTIGTSTFDLSSIRNAVELNCSLVTSVASLHFDIKGIIQTMTANILSAYNTDQQNQELFYRNLESVMPHIRRACRLFGYNVLALDGDVLASLFPQLPMEMPLADVIKAVLMRGPVVPWHSVEDFIRHRLKAALRTAVHANTKKPADAVGDPGLCGALNLGNTCYLNSVLQCLLHTPQLVRLMTQGWYCLLRTDTESPAADALALLMHDNWWGGHELDPTELLKVVQKSGKGHRFKLGDQHDAQEFLVVLLDIIGEELKLSPPTGTTRQLLPSRAANGDVDALAKQWRDAYLIEHNNVVTHMFSGQTIQRVSCPKCAAASFCCDSFSSLFIPLLYPPENERQVTIEACLAECFRAERVQMDANGRKCSTCLETSSKFVRRQGLYRLPPYLIICVNRFQKDDAGKFTRKRTTSLKFGARLYMGPWLAESVMPTALSESGLTYWSEKDRPQSQQGEYALFGVVTHVGNLDHGHYVSFCERSGHWFIFNDAQVTDSSLSPWAKPGCGSEVYMLFYRSLTGYNELHY